jgi:organic hydroperoxide reductase OsmC/OhrA
MSELQDHHATVTLVRGYEFIAEFPDNEGSPAILLDEPQPPGGGPATNTAALMGAAVGECLAASLAFCLRKSLVPVEGMTATVVTHVTRYEAGRFRIRGIDVDIVPELAGADAVKLDRCDQLFEDFCAMSQSIRQGIPVNVTVKRSHEMLTTR